MLQTTTIEHQAIDDEALIRQELAEHRAAFEATSAAMPASQVAKNASPA